MVDCVIYLKYMLSGNPCASIRCDGPLRIGPPRPCECPEPEKKKTRKREEEKKRRREKEKKRKKLKKNSMLGKHANKN